jgi:hypothetical protein
VGDMPANSRELCVPIVVGLAHETYE